ncbi:MAG: ABC transporter substrate-binding protein [Alphaproteobacteria bacterium]
MRRRDFLAGLVLAAMTGPARAQAPAQERRIAFVHVAIPADQLTETGSTLWIREFFQALRRLGYAEGRNLIVERYSAEGHLGRLADLARTVLSRNPDLIVTHGPFVAQFRAATATVPIVAIMADPISLGIVTSFARPGANITGAAVDAGIELYGKQLQILKEAVPSASKIAYLCSHLDWDGALGRDLRDSAQRLGLSLTGILIEEATPAQFRRAFAEIVQQQVNAMMVSTSGEYLANRQLIVELAGTSRLPGMYPYRDFVEAGGLMAYAPDLAELARQLADQVRQILQGAKPGDIPIYQATTFKLIVNLRAAKALGLTIPPSIFVRADEVIE